MAQIRNIVVEINPFQPIPEICSVIDAITSHQPELEKAILLGVQAAIERRLTIIAKGDEKDGQPVREPDAEQGD